jgi:alkylation response protein AidB-like acyl-CoA dehydrogenase
MISFTPTEEQQMLVDTIRRYAQNDLQPTAHDHDEQEFIPHQTLLKGWEIGLLPANIPESYGGFGEYSALTNVLSYEELAMGDLASAIKLMVPALFAFPILWGGTEEQKARFLPLFCEDKPYPATAALIEPSVAFDPLELKTTARRDGDAFVLNGEKAYVPLADGAEWMIVYARDTETGETNGYLVEVGAAQTEGLSLQRREKLMGIRALETYRLSLNEVRLPADAKLGGEDGYPFQCILDHSHVGLAAMAVGVARASHEYALEYAKQRVQFGKPIATKQAVAFMLAESRIEVDGTRMMVWNAAWQIDSHQPDPEIIKAAYLARHYADKAVLFVTDNGVQTLGGYGFIRDYPVERYLRNGRGFPMFTGLVLA